MKRHWPTCVQAVVVRLNPFWRCTCGRVLKSWDVILADDTAGIPCRVVCSACSAELLVIEQYQAGKDD